MMDNDQQATQKIQEEIELAKLIVEKLFLERVKATCETPKFRQADSELQSAYLKVAETIKLQFFEEIEKEIKQARHLIESTRTAYKWFCLGVAHGMSIQRQFGFKVHD